MPIINKDNLIKFGDNLFKVLKYRFADNSKSNVMQGAVIAKDFKSKSKTHIGRYKYSNSPGVVNTKSIFGKPNAIVTANTLVSRICVETVGYNVGDIVDKVNVFAVKNDNTIKELVVTNGTAIVIDHDGSYFNRNCNLLEIEIQKMFDEDVYFVVGCERNGNGGQAGHVTSDSRIAMDIPEGGLTVGTQLSPTTASGRINSMIIYGEDNVIIGGIRDWGELEYTQKRQYDNQLNIFNYGSKITGYWFGNNDSLDSAIPNSEYSMVFVDITPGKRYTVFKKTDDGVNRFFFLSEDNRRLTGANYSATNVGGWFKYSIPANHTNGDNGSRKKLAVQFKHDINGSQDIMVFEGDIADPPQAFIPYTGKQILIDSREVSLSYSSDNGKILSKTIHEAIDELSDKSFDGWSSLEDVIEYPYVNILNYNTRRNGLWYNNNDTGIPTANSSWSIIDINVEPNQEYTVARKYADSHRYYFFNDNTYVSKQNITPNSVNDWRCDVITIPSGVNKISIQFQHGMNTNQKMMMYKGNGLPPVNFIPYTKGVKVLVGTSVAYEFDNTNTSLNSTDLSSAVRELDGKVTNANTGVVRSINNQNPTQQGSVTLDGTHINANVDGSSTTIQTHLTNINTTLNSTRTTVNNHDKIIKRLETKHPVAQVGDIISTFQDSGDKYSVGGVTYLYIGQQRIIQSALYPQLAPALGISGATNYQLPVISDENFRFDNGQRNRARKYYIVANVDNLHKGV